MNHLSEILRHYDHYSVILPFNFHPQILNSKNVNYQFLNNTEEFFLNFLLIKSSHLPQFTFHNPLN